MEHPVRGTPYLRCMYVCMYVCTYKVAVGNLWALLPDGKRIQRVRTRFGPTNNVGAEDRGLTTPKA